MKYLVKSISTIILLAILITSVPIVSSARTYSDISSSHWAFNAINETTDNGILVPSGSTYNPNQIITRGEAVKALYIFIHAMVRPGATMPFTDVPSSYATYVKWAYDMEITSGRTETTFVPNGSLKKEEACMLIAQMYKAYGVQFSQVRDYYDYVGGVWVPAFSDHSSISSWATDAVIALYRHNIVGGSNGNFNPRSDITRAMFAVMLYQLYENIYFNSIKPVRITNGYSWCWAACATMVGSYGVSYTPMAVDSVVSHFKGGLPFDEGGSIAEIIAAAQYASGNTKYFMDYINVSTFSRTFNKAKIELRDNNPLIICGSAKNSDGTVKGDHTIVLNGYSINSKNEFIYCDPAFSVYRTATDSSVINGTTTGYTWYHTIGRDY